MPDDVHFSEGKPVMLYDGICIFCSAATAFILRNEKAPLIRFVAIQSPEGRRLAAAHGIDAGDPATFLFLSGGEDLSKSDGVLALTRYLRWPARALGVFRIVPKALRDWGYDRVAQNRYSMFGKADTCIDPGPGQRHRFTLPDTA